MPFSPATLDFQDARLSWNILRPEPVINKADQEPRPLTPRERKASFSRKDMWLKLDVGFDILTTYIFLPGPVHLGDVLDAMANFYNRKLSAAEQHVILESHVFQWGWSSKISPRAWLANATRGKMRGDSLYLEGFQQGHQNTYTPFFGS